jgi:branched-chain amino acid transport system substrate-binding protein
MRQRAPAQEHPRVRQYAFRDTIMGEAVFGPDGQLRSRHALFTVQDQKIVVRR